MRIFFDTNVLASAVSTRGLCADLFRAVLVDHDLVLGQVVLTELRRVLATKFRLPPETVREIEAQLGEHGVVPKPKAHLELGLSDRDDEWIVASAVLGRADVLVTGDRALRGFEGPPLRIVSPRELWEILRTQKSGG